MKAKSFLSVIIILMMLATVYVAFKAVTQGALVRPGNDTPSSVIIDSSGGLYNDEP